mmetsp:Transcript_35025/g.84778  ORF Transcript_35025/g.84778 Transcript_35025/m.84778 type:complete len:942 (-) Transcript_35025:27-2852(-)
MLWLAMLLFLLALAGSVVDAKDSDLVEKMLAGMTWDDLVGQMAQIDLAVLLNEDGTALVQDQLDHYIGKLGVGSVLNNVAKGDKIWTIADFRAAAVQIQQTAQKYKRPPVIWGLDSVHGANYLYNTITTPQPINIAATFNTTASFVAGKWASVDTRRAGIPWLFSPLLGLSWEPYWSRVYETFGEDPVVVGNMAKAMIEGIQNIDEDSSLVPSRGAACGKHWVGYSMPHNGHDRAPSWIPIRHLYQYFLLPWKMVVDEVDTIMESYTEFDGVPNVANRYTLNRLLRGKLGFEGMLVTDYHEIFNLNDWHHTASDRTDAMKQALEEGSVDMSMIATVPDEYFKAMEELKYAKYKARVTESARRVLKLKEKLNMFEEAFDMDDTVDDDGPTADDLQEALHMTTESIILAQNNGDILPLNADDSLRVLVTGPTSRSQSYQTGGWTFQWQGVEVDKEDAWFTYGSNVFDAVQNVSSWEVVHKCGVDILGKDCSDDGVDATSNGALDVASDMDVIIVGVGEENNAEKPGDTRDLHLPPGQVELVSNLRKRAPDARIVVVYFGGRVHLLGDIVENADAILLGFLPGPFAGEALRDIVIGEANPSGKLPITYPKYEDGGGIPYLHAVSDMCTKDTDGPLPHWDYGLCEVQWPFGHGHSYTQFEYTNLSIDSKQLRFSMNAKDMAGLTVSINVKNAGSMAGAETVLFFSFDEFRSTTPEYKRLRGFEKVYLEPGQSTDVTLSIAMDDLRFIGPHDNSHYILQDGMRFKIGVGAHTDCRADGDNALCSESITIQTHSEYTGACEAACDLWTQSGCDTELGMSAEVCWHDCTKIHQSDRVALNNDGWGWNYVECIESILFEPSFETESCWKLTSFCRDIFATPDMDEFGNGPTPSHHAGVIKPDHLAFALAFLSGITGAVMIITSMRGGVCSRRKGPAYEGVEMQVDTEIT